MLLTGPHPVKDSSWQYMPMLILYVRLEEDYMLNSILLKLISNVFLVYLYPWPRNSFITLNGNYIRHSFPFNRSVPVRHVRVCRENNAKTRAHYANVSTYKPEYLNTNAMTFQDLQTRCCLSMQRARPNQRGFL